MAPAGLVGHWIRTTVFDTTGYVNAVGPLVDKPRVQAAIADELTTALLREVNLPKPATAALRPLVRTSVQHSLASSAFAEVWVTTNRVAHQQIRLFLTNKSRFLRNTGGKVSVAYPAVLAPVLTTVRSDLPTRVRGIFDRIPVSTTKGQLVLIDSPALARAQTELAVANAAAWVLPIAALVMMLTAIAVSPRRRSTTIAVGVLVAISSALVRSGVTLVRVLALPRVSTSTSEHDLLAATYAALTGPLAHDSIATGFAGLLLALVAIGAGWLGRLRQRQSPPAIQSSDPSTTAPRHGTQISPPSTRARRRDRP